MQHPALRLQYVYGLPQSVMLMTPYTNVVSRKLCAISTVQNGLGYAVLIFENRGIEMPNVFLMLCFTVWFGAATNFTLDYVSFKQQPSQTGRSTRTSLKTNSVVYINKKFGFRFLLPEGWRGFSIVASEWNGGDGRTYQPGEAMPLPQKGPLILMRHPLWTKTNARQDIPIMIFTRAQWHLVEDGKLIVSAAPIGPSELGRNAMYVFALPPRYDYALPIGWEEVAEIIQHHPLRSRTPE